MQSYILTYHSLKKREPLIALGSHQGGPLHFCIRGTPPCAGVGGGGGRFEHPRLAEVVQNWLVALYDTRSESTQQLS